MRRRQAFSVSRLGANPAPGLIAFDGRFFSMDVHWEGLSFRTPVSERKVSEL